MIQHYWTAQPTLYIQMSVVVVVSDLLITFYVNYSSVCCHYCTAAAAAAIFSVRYGSLVVTNIFKILNIKY